MLSFIQWMSAVFAFGAAALWFYAARIPTPQSITQITIGDTGFGGELPKLFEAVSQQSKWNAYAALAACVAAFLQGVALACATTV